MPFLLDSLKDFLEFKWGIRDRFVIDKSTPLESRIYIAISSSTELSEALCHLQIDGEIVTIWRPQDWRIAYSKFNEDKVKAEERIAIYEKEKECIRYLEGLIIEKFGKDVGGPLAPSLAKEIVKGKKTNSAIMFGAEREKLIW